MKKRIIDTSNIEPAFRQDYLNISHDIAISAEGVIFKIGDVVHHEGADKEDISSITGFKIDTGSYDIIAITTKGSARISFLYH